MRAGPGLNRRCADPALQSATKVIEREKKPLSRAREADAPLRAGATGKPHALNYLLSGLSNCEQIERVQGSRGQARRLGRAEQHRAKQNQAWHWRVPENVIRIGCEGVSSVANR